MSGYLISAELRDIGWPWDLTSMPRRGLAARGCNPTPERVDHALAILPRVLDVQIRHNHTRTDRNATDPLLLRLGELLDDDDGLADLDIVLNGPMPTLADISRSRIRDQLERINQADLDLAWTSPPAEVIDYITDWWLGRTVLPGVANTLLIWLRDTLNIHPVYAGRVPGFLTLCEHYLHTRVTVPDTLVQSISSAGQRAALPALRRITTSPDLPSDIRAQAHSHIRAKTIPKNLHKITRLDPLSSPAEIQLYTVTPVTQQPSPGNTDEV